MELDYFSIVAPLLVEENKSGDAVFIKEFNSFTLFCLIDVLGHGKEAHSVAMMAIEVLESNYNKELERILELLHDRLLRTRGAVIALCRVDKKSDKIDYVGIGNITVRRLERNNGKFVPRDGIIGLTMPTPKVYSYDLHPNDTIVMYSDGIKEHFDILDVPEIKYQSAKEVAHSLLNKFKKNNDDASIITLRALS